LATTFRAFAAGISTTLHKVAAVRHSFAFGGAGFANGGASAAGLPVKLRHSQHKIRARLADLNAVLQKSDVLGGSVFAAYLKTLRNRFQTNGMAGHTITDAVLHLAAHRVLRSRRHSYYPP